MEPDNHSADSPDAAYEAHMEESAAEPYYTPTQAARILGMSDRWVRKELAEGRMEGEQDHRGRWYIPARVVEERRVATDKQRDYFQRGADLARGAAGTVYRDVASQPETNRYILDMLAEAVERNERLQYELGRAQARAEMLQTELDAERSKNQQP